MLCVVCASSTGGEAVQQRLPPTITESDAPRGASYAYPMGTPLTLAKLGPETLTPIVCAALQSRPIPLPSLLLPVGDAALELALSEALLDPTIAFAIHSIVAVDDHALVLNNRTSLPTRERISGTERLAAVVCGVGRGIDRRASAALATGNGRLALALDLIGTHALFRLSDYARGLVRKYGHSSGLMIGGPLEPGMDHFPLRDQATLVRLADAEPMGFFVTPSGAVGPGRVLTFAIPIGRDLPPWRPADRCLHCPSREACQRMGMAVDD